MAPSVRAGTEYWIGEPGVSADTNWSDAANWTGVSPSQTYFNEVQFIDIGANANNNTAVNNVLDSATGSSQMPMFELDYIPTNGNFTTLINPGVTMSIGAGDGWLVVGADAKNPGHPAPANSVETITIEGPGASLNMGGTLDVCQGSPSADTHNVTLDLSGLDNLVMSPIAGKSTYIYLASTGNDNSPRLQGVIYLAKTNNIVLADGIQICNQQSGMSNSLPVALYLGISNSITVGSGNNFNIGQSGTSTNGAFVEFNPAFLGGSTPPTAIFNSSGSGGRINDLYIANLNQSIAGYALCNLSGGLVNALVSGLNIGLSSTGIGAVNGVLTFDMGTINATVANVGDQQSSGGGKAAGTVNINTNSTYGTNATLVVNGALSLASASGTLTAGTAGTININGGALVAGSITNGLGTGTINATNGSLTVGSVAGTPAAPISVVSLANSSVTLPDRTNAMTIASLTTGGTTNLINISSVPSATTYPVQYPIQVVLIKYSGSVGGAGYNFGTGTLPAACAGYVTNDAANGSIDLVLTEIPLNETWTGSVNDNWDSTTANWLSGGLANTYVNGNYVQFLDGADTSTVNLTTALSPGGVTVSNGAAPYLFEGSGNLTGPGALNKLGTNTLVIDNSGANSFAGGVNINAGALQVGNNDANGSLPAGNVVDNGTLVFDQSELETNDDTISGTGGLVYEGGNELNVSGVNSFTGPVTVTNNGTLQFGSSSALGSGSSALTVTSGSTLDGNGYATTRPITVSGTGVGGNGAVTDTGGEIFDSSGGLSSKVTLADDTTFNEPNRWDLGSSSGTTLSTGGNPYSLTLNAGTYFEWENLSVDPALANIDLEGSGSFGVVGSTSLGNPADTLTIGSSATLKLYGANNFINKGVDDQDGYIQNLGGNNVMTGNMTLESGYCEFQVAAGASLTVSNVLSGPGLLYEQSYDSSAGNLIVSGNSPNFTGGAAVYAGTLTLNGLIDSGVTVYAGNLAGSGTAEGLVDITGGFMPGGTSSVGTFNAENGLTLESGTVMTNALAATVAGASDLTVVTGNLTLTGNALYINELGGVLQNGGVYPIITYTGTLSGSLGSVQTVQPSIFSLTVTNITTVTPNQIAVIASGTPLNLEWNNASGNGLWDVVSSYNWTNAAGLNDTQFNNGDNVTFDDSISSSTTASPTNVSVASGVTVYPLTVTVSNSAETYTLKGSGTIASGTVLKTGAGSVNIAMTNTYSGNTIIGAGTVKITGQFNASSSPLGSASGSIVISNGASLVINLPAGDAGFGTRSVVVSGAGVNGQGAIQNVGDAIYDDTNDFGLGFNITLAGNTTIAGYSRMDWGFPNEGMTLSTSGSNYNLTVIAGGFSEWDDFAIDPNLGNIDFYTTNTSLQTWEVCSMGGGLGNPTNILTLHSNVEMEVTRDTRYTAPAAADSGYAKVIHVMPTAEYANGISGGSGDYRDSTSFILDNGSTFNYYNGTGGTNSGTVFSGTVVLNGLVDFEVGNSLLTFSNVISGTGGFYISAYGSSPPMVLAAANTYQGITDVRAGFNLALIGNGSISDSTPISLASGAVLAVTNRTDGTLTLSSGQTLEGSGTVAGVLAAGSGSLLLPGITSTATNVGLLTVSGNATMNGTALMKLNNTTNDVISVGGTLTYGGTLALTNISATALASGQTFKLFNATAYSGAFSSILPASPGPGLFWNTSNLAVNGTISIVSMRINSIAVEGNTLTIMGTGPVNTQYVLMETTNLLAPLPWTPVLTNSFNNSGVLDLSTNIINASTPDEYYILQVQQ